MPMQITACALPQNSLLSTGQWDYTDSYSVNLTTENQPITPQLLAKAFFSGSPAWVEFLFKLRNKIVAGFGLKVPDSKPNIQDFEIKKGQTFGIFHIYDLTETEVILGENDKHLDFKVSLFCAKKEIIISNVVKYNNIAGRLYFAIVKPFHRLIVKSMLKNILKNLPLTS